MKAGRSASVQFKNVSELPLIHFWKVIRVRLAWMSVRQNKRNYKSLLAFQIIFLCIQFKNFDKCVYRITNWPSIILIMLRFLRRMLHQRISYHVKNVSNFAICNVERFQAVDYVSCVSCNANGQKLNAIETTLVLYTQYGECKIEVKQTAYTMCEWFCLYFALHIAFARCYFLHQQFSKVLCFLMRVMASLEILCFSLFVFFTSYLVVPIFFSPSRAR